MWEYNQIQGNARSGVLMHKDHKYIDKYRDAKGNWQYVYDTAKSGASRAASATASAAKSAYAAAKPVASKAASATASAAKKAASATASAAKSAYAAAKPAAPKTASAAPKAAPAAQPKPNAGKTAAQGNQNAAAQKNQEAAKKAAEVQKKAKADTQKGMQNIETYRKLYTMLSNGSYPMNYRDPVSGKTVTVKDRSGAAQAKANIANAASKVYQDNNKRFTMMNQKDPDIGNMARQNEQAMAMFNQVKKQYIGKETR